MSIVELLFYFFSLVLIGAAVGERYEAMIANDKAADAPYR